MTKDDPDRARRCPECGSIGVRTCGCECFDSQLECPYCGTVGIDPDPSGLAEIRACVDEWSGKRDADGHRIVGPEWDTEDIVRALGRLLAMFDELSAEHRRALDLLGELGATGLLKPGDRP